MLFRSGGFGGESFLNGGVGAVPGRLDSACFQDAYGGFGGGGSTSCNTVGGGGGGGYSGGAGGPHINNCGAALRSGGGGGGSYNLGTDQINTAGARTGHGLVVITEVCTPTPDPTDVTATPSEICSGSSSDLNATATGAEISWYTEATGGVAIGTSDSEENFSVSPTTTTTYYAEAKLQNILEEEFNYTGTVQTWTVPAGVTKIKIEAWGAQGGGDRKSVV